MRNARPRRAGRSDCEICGFALVWDMIATALTGGASRLGAFRRLPFVVSVGLLLAGCPSPGTLAPPPPKVSVASSCAEPLVVPFHAAADGPALTRAEKRDLLMSAVGRVAMADVTPGGGEQPCGDDRIEAHLLSDRGGSPTTAFVRYERLQGPPPDRTANYGVLLGTTRYFVGRGGCDTAWEYLAPFVAAGSSEAAGVLWAASRGLLTTGESWSYTGFRIGGKAGRPLAGWEGTPALIAASLPVGPNDIYTGTDEIRMLAGGVLNRRLRNFASDTGCDFQTPTFECRKLVMEAGAVTPIDSYSGILTGDDPAPRITCRLKNVKRRS